MDCREHPFGPGLTLRTCVGRAYGKFERASFSVRRDGQTVGVLEINRRSSTRDQVTASMVEISDPKLRRAKLGTKLYEKALELTCREGLRLGSSSMRSEFSEAFWRKQVRKGRARCEGGKGVGPGSYYRIPRAELLELGLQDSEVREATRKLPKPKRDAQGEGFWRCPRYVIKKETCRKPELGRIRPR